MPIKKNKSPMLADHDSIHTFSDKLRFPLYATPKIDGFRCVNSEGRAVSRSFTDIPNRHIFKNISAADLAGLDGELIAGGKHANIFNATSSCVTTHRFEPVFEWHLFDDFSDPLLSYEQRLISLCERYIALCQKYDFIRFVEPTKINSWEELLAYETEVLDAGFEGVITRNPDESYKFGRSTQSEQGMLKLKRFEDAEAEVVGFGEATTNTNPDLKDNFGHAKRSKAQGGLVASGTLGKLHCRDLTSGVEFDIGMFKGLTLGDKQKIWDNQDKYLGKLVKYSSFKMNALEKPRHSKFLGWRDKSDM